MGINIVCKKPNRFLKPVRFKTTMSEVLYPAPCNPKPARAKSQKPRANSQQPIAKSQKLNITFTYT
ncbi:MAG: hypothetical protein PHP31_09785 [Lentimicrobiaceae bacterium]|nr:hypothetical protein [Lentimicrobiaceae bacterium]